MKNEESYLRARVIELEGQLADASREHARIDGVQQEDLAYVVSIVDTVRMPLLVLDAELRVSTASAAFYRTFALSREETIGRYLSDIGNEGWNIPALRTLLAELLVKGGTLTDFEVVHEFRRLGPRVMLLNAQRFCRGNGAAARVLLGIDDVTERRLIEEKLLRSNENLERFAYVAAHDLRSPLNSALTLMKLLERLLEGKLDEDEAGMVTESILSMERLGALIRDILAYSEVEHVPQPQSVIPLEEPLNMALANLQHHIADCQATITVGKLPSAPVNRTQIGMVFQNLISNALKYRRKETPLINIQAMREGTFWKISVSDNGQGFEAAYAAAIFEPFKRLHGHSVPGSGIGLATCKRIIEREGGRISAVSIPGTGSTFYFTVPLER